jgi:hypothetical protein
MAINPNIALSFQGPKFEDPVNRLAQFEQLRQYQQNAMLKEQEMRLNQQKLESQNALKNLYASGQPVTLQQAMKAGGLEGAKFYADIKSAEEKELKAKSAATKAFDDALKSAKSVFSSTQDNRESYSQAYENVINRFPDLKPYIETPDMFKPGRRGTLQRLTISANDLLSNENKRNETAMAAVQNLVNQANNLSSEIFKVTPEGVTVEDPYAKAQYRQLVGRLNQILQEGGFPISGMQDVTAGTPSAATGLGSKTPVGSGVLEQPVDTATTPLPPSPAPEAGMPVARAGGIIPEEIASAKARVEGKKKEAELTAISDKQKQNNINMARRLLDRVGYDPETDTSTTEELIAGSSGGGIDTLISNAARAVGYTTPGMANIGQLKALSSEITKDFLGGNLGAGISNPDRDFIQQMSGDIGNPNLTTGERVAAFRQFIIGLKKIAEQGYYINPKTGLPDGGAAASAPTKASSSNSQSGFEMGDGWSVTVKKEDK